MQRRERKMVMWSPGGKVNAVCLYILTAIRFSRVELNVWVQISGLCRVDCRGFSNVSANPAVIFRINTRRKGLETHIALAFGIMSDTMPNARATYKLLNPS
jgi:hypothetical protein